VKQIKKLNIALTFNLKPNEPSGCNNCEDSSISSNEDEYAEWDTEETIFAVRDALAQNHNVTLIEANNECFSKLQSVKPDFVFNIAEGKKGINREAHIPAILEFLEIPYSGSDPLTLSSTLNKARTKEILTYHNIPNAKFVLANSINDIDDFNLEFPVILKPIGEGSSKGIYNSSVVNNYSELEERLSEKLGLYNQPCIIEEFLTGREFTVAVLGNSPDIKVLPIVEINFSELPKDLAPIYSYEAKWIADTKENPLEIFSCPADLSNNLKEQIESIALKTYKVLDCKDWSRIDIRLDKFGIPNIIEVNPLPGILPDPLSNSCYPKAARAAGMDYNTLINNVLNIALKRHNLL